MESNGLLNIVSNAKEIYVTTGNVNSCANLVRQKGLANPSDEVQECLRLVFGKDRGKINQNDESSKCDVEISQQNGVVCIGADTIIPWEIEEREGGHLNRSDIKLTLKIFLGIATAGDEAMETAVDLLLKELHTEYIDSLIVSFPSGAANAAESAQKFYELVVKQIWAKMEALVDNKKVQTIGVADLDVAELEALYNAARIKPSVNHYNIASCCSVPPELVSYAKSHGIQLLTHNDPPDFLPKEALNSVLKSIDGIQMEEVGKWHLKWVARYTAMITNRSVISVKAFVVNLIKS